MLGLLTEEVAKATRPRFETDYIGKVEDNEDPKQLGRLRIRIPELYGSIDKEALPWATPCTPFGGGGYGFFAIPQVGANVRVSLFRSHPWFPIWTGVLWLDGEVADEFKVTPPKVFGLKTPSGHIIELSEKDGEEYILLKDSAGNFLKLDTTNGKREDEVSGDLSSKAGGNVTTEAGGEMEIKAGGKINIEASGKIVVKGDTIEIDGGGATSGGVVTDKHICAFTKRPHSHSSQTVTVTI